MGVDNGKNFGVKIKYIKERKPLGTAGALSKIGSLKFLYLL